MKDIYLFFCKLLECFVDFVVLEFGGVAVFVVGGFQAETVFDDFELVEMLVLA